MPTPPHTIFDSKSHGPPGDKNTVEKNVSNYKSTHYFSEPRKENNAFFISSEDYQKGGKASSDSSDVNKNYHDKYKEGIEEAFKETVKEQYKNHYKFYGLLHKTSQLIHKIKNIIPVFTTDILIESTKITIINRPFFFSEYIQSIEIGNLQRVWIETAPFFATLKILDNSPRNNELMVRWIWKKDAEKARRIINGLMEAEKDEVDLTTINHEELVEKLEEIGKLQETITSVSNA